MELNPARALIMLRDNTDKLPVEVVMPQLEKHPKSVQEGMKNLPSFPSPAHPAPHPHSPPL